LILGGSIGLSVARHSRGCTLGSTASSKSDSAVPFLEPAYADHAETSHCEHFNNAQQNQLSGDRKVSSKRASIDIPAQGKNIAWPELYLACEGESSQDIRSIIEPICWQSFGLH
jgi:hypothetical protein